MIDRSHFGTHDEMRSSSLIMVYGYMWSYISKPYMDVSTIQNKFFGAPSSIIDKWMKSIFTIVYYYFYNK